MINLGPYSGKHCPNVRLHPSLPDRVLEGAALLLVLAACGCICWFYTHKEGEFPPHLWWVGASSLLCFLIVGGASYLPVRFINFPVRVGERNVGVQYLLVVRLTRVVNVILSLMFLGGVLSERFAWGGVVLVLACVLLAIAFGVYYFLAFRYK